MEMNRQIQLEKLRSDHEFDLLVIGGGATGTGVAVDAASRGLDVALVDRMDFAEGTSSKSTKMVHGGVRYLEKAILQLDREQFDLVREGLHERAILLKNAPHLARPLKLMTPVKSFFEAAYVFAGLVLYDILAGKLRLGGSRLFGIRRAKRLFPSLRLDGFKAAVTYFDGQFNDARMAVTLARTAAEQGATCANHVEVTGLVKDGTRVCGATVRDMITDEEWTVRARGVINAAGPFADAVRRMDDPAAKDILKASSGIHIMLNADFTPPDLSLMIPKTEDGRVLFMIPWMGHVVFGTTDESAPVEFNPVPSDEDIDYLLRYASKYLDRPVVRDDIKAAWSGLRPLVFSCGKGSTQELARTHVIETGPGGLLTITGGKWTSYRRMAEDTVDRALEIFGLRPAKGCVTRGLRLVGARAFDADAADKLALRYSVSADVAAALLQSYGDEAADVLELAAAEGLEKRLHPAQPHIEAEVAFAVRREFAEHLGDVLIRRMPMGLCDVEHAVASAERAAEIMAAELGWDDVRREDEVRAFIDHITEWFTPEAMKASEAEKATTQLPSENGTAPQAAAE